MLFKPPISTDIVTIPKQYATLRAVRGNEGARRFIYEFAFSIDVTKALRADALSLEIRLLAKKPEKSKMNPWDPTVWRHSFPVVLVVGNPNIQTFEELSNRHIDMVHL